MSSTYTDKKPVKIYLYQETSRRYTKWQGHCYLSSLDLLCSLLQILAKLFPLNESKGLRNWKIFFVRNNCSVNMTWSIVASMYLYAHIMSMCASVYMCVHMYMSLCVYMFLCMYAYLYLRSCKLHHIHNGRTNSSPPTKGWTNITKIAYVERFKNSSESRNKWYIKR